MSDSVEVSRRMRNQSWAILRHSIPMSRRVRDGINMVSMRNVVDVGRGVMDVGWTSVPMIDWPECCMRYSVEMGRCMRNRVNMIPVPDIVVVCRCMRHVMEMSFLVEALCACQLSHSENGNGCHDDCARFKHFILSERCCDSF